MWFIYLLLSMPCNYPVHRFLQPRCRNEAQPRWFSVWHQKRIESQICPSDIEEVCKIPSPKLQYTRPLLKENMKIKYKTENDCPWSYQKSFLTSFYAFLLYRAKYYGNICLWYASATNVLLNVHLQPSVRQPCNMLSPTVHFQFN